MMNPLEIISSFWMDYYDGLMITLQLSAIGALLAGVLSLPLALARLHAHWMLQLPLRVYVSFVRGTPMLAQLFLIYYGSGQFRPLLEELGLWVFFRDPYYCALMTFVLNSTAYQIEIMRGGLTGVPHGQIEAASAIGMSRFTMYRRVILPHAYRISWPALGNEIILLIKASALASVVTVFDLMGKTRLIFSKTYDLSAYLWATVIYLLLVVMLVWVWRKLEVYFNAHFYSERLTTQKRSKNEYQYEK
ncbi:ABC transporter permease [Aliamphritea ceti]|uniref:ABC transporter permease n=1 Tax=Aliamphritea ceti TaxID=1524258 RepID=UPI0021C25D8B|nr:ABC transporter permease subunit [Aliamphritea ceti]